MRVFDLHSDLFTDIAWRKSSGEKDIFDRYHYPNLKKGGVDSIICVFWVEPKFCEQAYDRFQTLFTYVMEDLKTSKHAIIHDPNQPYENPSHSSSIKIHLGLEGLTFMDDWPGETPESKIENAFNQLDQSNVMHSIFAWNEHNFLSTGTGADSYQEKGLTTSGKYALQQSIDHNWLLDVSHQDEATFWDIYNLSEHPFIASHSNAKAICDHERNLTDEQIKAIANRGGIIGLNAYGAFVDKDSPTVERFIDHAIHIADLVGYEHLAFGFDFVDYLASYNLGGSGFTEYTKGLENVSKVPDLLDRMSKRGFSTKELEAVSFTNASLFMKNHHTLRK
ncbi:membrane dipeptidase [Virgibacillus sp. C22-A2]|uniref:Membrane dipeptidase n=1 Tax=Virgibacillus tibetensis TaxID=3042313 RepID=A0ABU6KCV9_9BACI|nr:membrane dipeptidase [Virgibacillus sp. C22-A2]